MKLHGLPYRSHQEACLNLTMPGSAQIIRRIIVSATCKGGVGRTFFLVNLADWYAEIEQDCAFFDSDIYNGTLTRFLPDSRFLPLDNPDEAVRELSEVLDDSEVVGWDALGPMKGYYPDFLDETFVQNKDRFSEHRVTMILMIEEDKDTVFQAGEMAKRLGDQVDWLVVKNHKTCSTSEIYDNSKARQELLRLGAVEITMERVPWSLLATIQKTSRGLSSLVLDESLPFLERQRLRTFQKRFFEQLESARALLVPTRLAMTAPVHKAGKPASSARPRVAPEEV